MRDRIEGPIVMAEGYGKAAYGELVEVHAADGVRLGQVLTTGEDRVIAELWSETAGLHPHEILLRFRGETFHTGVSREMLGRVFDGLGRPRDGLPPPLAEARVDMHGSPFEPHRACVSAGFHRDRHLRDRRDEHRGAGAEASHILRRWTPA